MKKISQIILMLVVLMSISVFLGCNFDVSSKDSAVGINMTHQKNNGSNWIERSVSFTGTYSNNTITINESGKSYVFTKQ